MLLDRARMLDETERRWTDRTQTLRFLIHGPTGDLTRELRLYERRSSARERRVLIRLLAPANLRDFGFLAFSTLGGGGRQWLYQPGAPRSRPLSSGARGFAFVDSDLTYEDIDMLALLPAWTDADAAAVGRGEETVDGVPCHVIELTPRRSNVSYRRIVLWLGESDLLARRLDLIEDGSRVVKRIVQMDVRNVGRIPVAHQMRIETIAARSSTEVSVHESVFDIGISDDCLSEVTLAQPTREAAVCGVPPARP